MKIKHPSDEDLALYAGGDLGWIAKRGVERHIALCGDCEAATVGFSAFRAELAGINDRVTLPWSRMAAEMRANIRLGLEAGECVGFKPRAGSGFRAAMAFASLALLLGAGLLLHRPATETPNAVVLEATDGGIQVREGEQVLSILNSRAYRATDVIRTVGAQGEMRARFVDSKTGLVTVNNVYVQ